MRLISLLLFLISTNGFAQMTKQDSVWLPLKNIIGNWKGTGQGPDGKGTYERSYQFALNKKYIQLKNKTVYPATPENPKGYVHEDFGVISYDKALKKFVFRQFHGEGFVNHYVLESISPDGKTVVFATAAIENIPNGWRGRETYTFGDGEFSEAFDLAEPGKDFEPYTRATFKKIN